MRNVPPNKNNAIPTAKAIKTQHKHTQTHTNTAKTQHKHNTNTHKQNKQTYKQQMSIIIDLVKLKKQ